jgi:RNA polymerase sigma-70 factor, ECF subfamily
MIRPRRFSTTHPQTGSPLRRRRAPGSDTPDTTLFPRTRRRSEHQVEHQPVLDRQLRELIDEHAAAVYHVAFGVLHDRGLAEDVVQETMIKAWEASSTFRGDSSMRTWILRIAHNTAIDALRRRRDRTMAPEDLPDEPGGHAEHDPARRAAGRADLELLRAALAELDELSRTIVVLREVEDMSYQQIAEALDVPIATVKTRLLRARRVLQSAVLDHERGAT